MELDIRKLQLKCLEILDKVHQICINNGIQYSLCGGSVVGAHLYKGFLPWDDDIDIMMTRDNYNRFLSLAPSLLPDGFEMINYQTGDNFIMGYTKIVNSNTTYIQKNGRVVGIFLDITVYDKIPKNFLRNIDLSLFRLSLTVTKGKMPGNSLKNCFRSFLLDTIISNKREYFMFFQKIVESLARTDNYEYAELFGAIGWFVPYRPSVFEYYTTIEFEGKRYSIVRDYLEYLKTRYNRVDFYVPKEEQVAPHVRFVDFSLPYRDYLLAMNKKSF